MARLHRFPLLAFLIFCLVNFAFLLRFADRDGYEGDDLNSILPMAHLGAAKEGALLIYRYAWQPLSYELGSLTWSLFGTPTAVFLMAPVAGATALGLLFWWLWREGRSGPAPVLNAFIVLLAVPELWYSASYYNSTILGMPLLAGALLLVRGGKGLLAPAMAGVLTGLAILLRMDFILICPLLAVAAWPRGKGLTRPIVLAAAVVATLLVGFAAGLLDLAEILRIQAASAAEISDKAHQAGWDLRMKLQVASITLSPIGWLLLAVSGAVLLGQALRRRDWRALLWIGAALPATYPLFNILSAKYFLPLAPFALLMFQHGLARAETLVGDRWRLPVTAILIAGAGLPLFVSVSFSSRALAVAIGGEPDRPVGTHDGPRGYGGYVGQIMALDGPTAQTAEQREAATLAQELASRNLLIAGGENFFDKGGIGWRHLQLRLERQGVHGVLEQPHRLRFTLPNRRQLVLASAPDDVSMADPHRLVDMRTPTDEH